MKVPNYLMEVRYWDVRMYALPYLNPEEMNDVPLDEPWGHTLNIVDEYEGKNRKIYVKITDYLRATSVISSVL